MNCQTCNGQTKKAGKDRKGHQRFQCLTCKKTFIEPYEKPLGNMILAEDKALSVLHHLVEGCSIRTTERITGVHRDTIMSLLEFVGDKCEKLLEERIQNVSVKHVQLDEIWGYVGMKEKMKKRKSIDDSTIGDAYTFVAIEEYTKLVLCWHLGRRTASDTFAFTEKLASATANHSFQVSADGFAAYKDAIVHSLGAKHVDFATVVKFYDNLYGDETRYSMPEVTRIEKKAAFGNPDLEIACTSHVERQNLTMRMSMRRLTRMSNGFSKKRRMLKAMLALYFTYYNFCRIHKTLRVTPAIEAKLTDHVWELKELLTA